jgi:hypothetical protein
MSKSLLKVFKRELAIHYLEGFSYQRAAILCKVPKNYKVLARIAIGKRTNKKNKRSAQRPLREMVSE